jgi:hypothetical protein
MIAATTKTMSGPERLAFLSVGREDDSISDRMRDLELECLRENLHSASGLCQELSHGDGDLFDVSFEGEVACVQKLVGGVGASRAIKQERTSTESGRRR